MGAAKITCPLCQKEISVAAGQRVFGCGDCRKKIREHNKKVLKRERQREQYAKAHKTRS